ncbi:MAG: hypothetical protein ABFD49_03035 [Armatimonadota bacterium]|nr:hypothetical protein [bacterium]
MRALITILFWAICANAAASPTSQLYTGDAVTVPPGITQFQCYYDAAFGGSQRVAGGSLTFGATNRLDAKLGYGYLWNNVGPDVRLGPNIGVKWRVVGDGAKEPSLAFSSLFAINDGVGGKPHKNDFGELMIVQYPTKPAILLLNYGRVWVGDTHASDIGYFAFAAARFIKPHTLLAALEYSALRRVMNTRQERSIEQIAAALVYAPDKSHSYTLQLADLLIEDSSTMHLSLGISLNL